MGHEVCDVCGEKTGKAGKGEDSLYIGTEGPYCDGCYPEVLRTTLEHVIQEQVSTRQTFWQMFAKIQVWSIRPGGSGEETERPRDDDAIIERHEQMLTEKQKEYLANNGHLVGAVGIPISKDFFQIHVPVACNVEEAMAQLIAKLKAAQ